MEEKKPKLDLSSASGRMVWLVYAQHWVVMAQACSQPSPSSSSRILISSGTTISLAILFTTIYVDIRDADKGPHEGL